MAHLSKRESWATSARRKLGLPRQEGSLAYINKREAWPTAARGQPTYPPFPEKSEFKYAKQVNMFSYLN